MSLKTKNITKIEEAIEKDNFLTYRELEYLSLVAVGYKNKKIAKELVVTVSTVKKTLENIFRKLQAKDRANAVAIAFIDEEILSEISIKYHIKNKINITDE